MGHTCVMPQPSASFQEVKQLGRLQQNVVSKSLKKKKESNATIIFSLP